MIEQEPLEVRTRSIATAAALVLLGHDATVYTDEYGTTYKFPPSAEADLRRMVVARRQLEAKADAARGARPIRAHLLER